MASRRSVPAAVLALAALAAAPLAARAAAKEKEQQPSGKPEPRMSAATFAGLEFRNLGPALMSGRIADIALDPRDPSVWYVAVGSGGVFKTTNAGTTWKPLFDKERSYSIGCVTVDPSNPSTVWVGTGENVGGRHVGFGDGVYRSDDGGATWTHVGLGESQHVSKIVVHPRDSNMVWVAAQGPLWSPGGERGLYRSTDRGRTWKKLLGGGEWTGVTDVVLDPRGDSPAQATLYAATWQKQRTVAAYLGGGPESGVHKSTDGGETWTQLAGGLPTGNLGKIGLALSPQNPDVLYAAIELDLRKGGVFRSADRGASWEKRSDAVAGATGPHYYQELYASPHAFDRIYLVDFRIQVSDDGGKSFRRLEEKQKHSDNHVIVFRADDPDYLLVGTDGGLYETFDLAQTWRFVANLPVTQFYKLAVDDDAPFYNVYGGTQDNSTQGGPVRTDSVVGIPNSAWFITVFADGHQPATEPGNPDIVYSEWQQGNLVRYDRTTGEIVYVTPQGEPGDPPDRFNWDSPILVSPHSPTRLYYASQRVFRSDDRGDSWRPVSGDLTRNVDRLKLRHLGRQWSYEAPWDLDAMSLYSTITSLAESPRREGLLYAGTDDGLIQVSEDGGGSWRRIEVGSLPNAPAAAFVNDIEADLFDADTVYVALDDHKSGDFAPYLYASTDRGRSWRSIAGDLPARHLVWRLAQDHVKPGLLFAATEFGIFFTVDGGARWVELTGGVPTISFRDLAIQRREDDLLGASFGRGFFVLDDYSPLRAVDEAQLASGALLFPPRDAWWYVPRRPYGDDTPGPADQGASFYVAPNPPFGAVFTYYLAEERTQRAKTRQEADKKLAEAGADTPFPPFETLEAERREAEPKLLLLVRDASGALVRRLEAPAAKGFHRVAWDLRHPAPDAVTSNKPPEGDFVPRGALAAPGRYTVELAELLGGETKPLAGPAGFEVKPLRTGKLPGAPLAEVSAFGLELDAFERELDAAGETLDRAAERLELLALALARSKAGPELDRDWHALRQELFDLEVALRGEPRKNELSVPTPPTISGRLQVARIGVAFSTYGPTPTHRRSLALAREEYARFEPRLRALVETKIPGFEHELEAIGAPWTPGRPLPE
jgi:photosystem II stability/assembly factor-like uncharacterized protein